MGQKELSVIHEVPKGCTGYVTKNFRYREYDCPCDYGDCTWTLVSGDLAVRVQKLRDLADQPVTITNGYRCHKYQEDLRARGYETAKGVSTHEKGEAADIVIPLMTGEEAAVVARQAGFTSVGIGKKFIHVDTRPGFREWSYHGR